MAANCSTEVEPVFSSIHFSIIVSFLSTFNATKYIANSDTVELAFSPANYKAHSTIHQLSISTTVRSTIY
jgi:hypothetical protein